MPRKSKRKVFIDGLEKLLKSRIKARGIRMLFDEEDSLEDAKDLALLCSLKSAHNRRYLFRSPNYRKGQDRFMQDLECDPDDSVEEEASHLPWLTEDEFLQKYRTTRENFGRILVLIEDHPVFHVKKEGDKGRNQAPIAHQLMVFLKFLGSEGAGGSNSNQRQTFAVGYGTSAVYRKRVTQATLSLRDKYIHWPDEAERITIARETHAKYGFPHCLGIGDGTLFPLAFEPQTEDAPDYPGRKYGYSLSTLIFCDHHRRIRYYISGFPGSAHDNRLCKASHLKKHPTSYFDSRQCVVGDSAFENGPNMVAAFKKLPNSQIPRDQENFNSKLAKLRIISEHCIGMLKGRFPWLRSIRLLLTEDVKSLRTILQLIDASVILHNILIDFGEEDRDEWIDSDDFSDMDEATRAPYEEGDELNQSIPGWMPKDTRRTQLLNYFSEFYFL